MTTQNIRFILGSSSPARADVLRRLKLEFEQISPDIDETQHSDESPSDLVKRLALSKAQAVAKHINHKNSIIIASDSVAEINGTILGKPHDHRTAVAMLKNQSGQTSCYHNGLCVYDLRNNQYQVVDELFKVTFHRLTDDQIEGYLLKEQPYKCSGAFRSEGLGVALAKAYSGKDFNALIGLPAITLCELLRNIGIEVCN